MLTVYFDIVITTIKIKIKITNKLQWFLVNPNLIKRYRNNKHLWRIPYFVITNTYHHVLWTALGKTLDKRRRNAAFQTTLLLSILFRHSVRHVHFGGFTDCGRPLRNFTFQLNSCTPLISKLSERCSRFSEF